MRIPFESDFFCIFFLAGWSVLANLLLMSPILYF
jgi:hypothetical protein